MPRPDAVVIAVEQSDQGIARRCSGREIDLVVHVADGLDNGAARRTALPDHLGGLSVEIAGFDARRRFVVAHHMRVEFVAASGLGGDVAVGGSCSREILGDIMQCIDGAVFGRRKRIGSLLGQQFGRGEVLAGVKPMEQPVLLDGDRTSAPFGNKEVRVAFDRISHTRHEGDLVRPSRADADHPHVALEFGVDAGAEPSRGISIGLSFGEQLCKLIVCIPPGKAIPRSRCCRQGATFFGAHDPKILRRADLLRGQSPGGRYAALPVLDRAVFHIGFHLVGVAVGEVVALPVAVFVLNGHRVAQQVVVLRYDLREIGHLVRALALEFPDLEIEIAARTDAVKLHALGIAPGNLHLSRQRDLILVSLDCDVKRPLRVYGAVTAAGVLGQIIPHRERIAAHARIDFVVAQNGYVERMVRIAPDVEIRGVVLAQIDPVSQHLLATHGTDHKIRGMRRGIVAVLVPLRGDACNRSLPVLGHIEGRAIVRSRIVGNILIAARAVVGSNSRRSAVAEEASFARDIVEAHRFQADIRDLFSY